MKIVFLFNDFSLHNQIVKKFIKDRPQDEVSIVRVPLVLKGKNRTDSAVKILPKISLRFAYEKLAEFVAVKLITYCPKILPRGEVFSSLKNIAQANNARFIISGNIMDSQTIAAIAELKPDLIICLFHQIIKQQLINIPRYGIINLHPGILPEFKGIQPYFWELANGFGEGGGTIHYIEDEQVDTGRIIARTRYKIIKNMSVQLNYFLTCKAMASILGEVVTAIEADKIQSEPQQPGSGAYFGWPTSQAVEQLYLRGHPIVSFIDLMDILCGKYDDFRAGTAKINYKQDVINQPDDNDS